MIHSIQSLKFYRRCRGGVWRKYQGTGHLPGLYGSWWTRNREMPLHRYYELIKVEKY